MLDSSLYIYVVARDFGFAPNPFHGICTLATCKPVIRRNAKLDDWVVGMGGSRLKRTGKCIFAMKVTSHVDFNTYFCAPEFQCKKPVRNGSNKMLVGDNIYSSDGGEGEWLQLDSHHSLPDGSVNIANLTTDTGADRVLLSDHFYYFGSEAVDVPAEVLATLGYRNGRSHRRFNLVEAACMVDWLEESFQAKRNQILGDPCDFGQCDLRYTGRGSQLR